MSPELPESLRLLFRVLDVLDKLGIAHHLGGSFASSIHGVPRQTQDIDLVVELDEEAAGKLLTELGDDFYASSDRASQAIETAGSFNAIHIASGIKIDFFIRGPSDFDREEFARRIPMRLSESPPRDAFVKTAEDTVLRKLLWFREGGESSDRQWNDILGVLRNQGSRLDNEYLTRWLKRLSLSDLFGRAQRELERRAMD